MNLLESFELKLDKSLEAVAKKLEISYVKANKTDNTVIIEVTSDTIIDCNKIILLENNINAQFFKNSVSRTNLVVKYSLAFNKSLNEIWDEYSDYLINELCSKNDYYFTIIDNADFNIDGDIINITSDYDMIAKLLKNELAKELSSIIYNHFDKSAFVNVEFRPEAVIKQSDFPVYEFYSDSSYPNRGEEAIPKDIRKKPVKKKDSEEASNVPKQNKPAKQEFKYKKKAPDDPDIFYGRSFIGDSFSLSEVTDGLNNIVVKGMIFKVDLKEIKNDRLIVIFNLTDFTDSISCKLFSNKEEWSELKNNIKEGAYISAMCNCEFDKFDNSLSLSRFTGIKKISNFKKTRKDDSEVKRIELHAHTQLSDMDAVVSATSLVNTAFSWGHPAVAITDHGVTQAFPEASHAINSKKFADDAEKMALYKKFKIIYGCEGYMVNDDDLVDENGQLLVSEEDYLNEIHKRKYFHVIILCKNDLGRSHLYKLVSDSHLKFYSKRPRIPKSELKKNKEGLIIGGACEAGEIFRAIVAKTPKEELDRICELYDYYEIQPIGNNRYMVRDNDRYPDVRNDQDLINFNKAVVELADEHHKLCCATCDVHFLNPEDEIYRRIIQASKGFKDADLQPPLYLRTTSEMLNEFMYLGEEKAKEVVITNTLKIGNMIEKIAPVRPDKCPPVIENSDNELRDMCYAKARSMYGEEIPEIVKTRLDKELNSIISNGYSVMYIIAQRLVKKSNDDGYLVGSRGSVGSSFVATMSGITEVNPLQPHYYCTNCFYSDFDSDIVKDAIERQISGYDMQDRMCPVCGKRLFRDGQNIPFETFLGFNGDKEPDIDLNFSGAYQSKAHAYTEVLFGTGHTFKAGTIGTLADKTAFGMIKKYYEEKEIEKRGAEIDRLVGGCVGVRRTTGQHPGGIVVLPHGEEIYTFTPVQHPANDMTSDIVTTHFDYHSIDHNLLKLDILGHDDPTMIRFLEDLTGEDAKTWPMDDKKVISLFSSTEALGCSPEDIECELGSLGLPELGTNFVMNMLKETKPESFSDMIRISGLSHGTDVWTNNAQELIKEGKCTLPTAICTRDDIMTFLILKGVEAGRAFKIMESVRKGKGLTEEMEATMIENNIPDWYIWSCKKIKYMFPKAHACAYIMMAFRIAYCKVYHPLAYYAAYFSIRATDFDYEIMAQGKAHLQEEMDKLKVKINNHTNTPKENDLYEDAKLVREMYARGFEFMPIDIYKAKADKFQIIDGKLMPSLSTINGMGGKAAELAELAANDGPFSSRNDFKNRAKVPGTVIDTMNRLGLFGDIPEDEQLSFADLFNLG